METQEKLQQALEAAAASSKNVNNNDDDDDDDISDGEDSVQLEGNTDAWMTNYVQLREHVVVHGNCQVASKNKKLQKWVANQKLAYTHVKEGKKKGPTISPERIALLEGLGCFHWGKKFPPTPSWEEHFASLQKYAQATGNTNVAMHPTNPSAMAKWVSAQRSEYKRFTKGQVSLLT